MGDEEFEGLIREAVLEIPEEFRQKLENIEIVTQDFPSEYQLKILRKRKEKGLLLGLYEGIPQIKRGNYGIGPTIPDKITIFKYPLMSISKSIDELKVNVKNTLIHEFAHHFGIDDQTLRKMNK